MTFRSISPELVGDRRDVLRVALDATPFDAVLALSVANVDYASGYRSVGAAVHGIPSTAALVSDSQLIVVGTAADSAPAFDFGIPEDSYVAYGKFFFESRDGLATATGLSDQHLGYAAAIATAVINLGLTAGTIGIDDRACPAELRAQLAELLPSVAFVDSSDWLAGVRARKLDGEVALIGESARIAEAGIVAGIAAAGVGVTEREIARVVAGSMVAAGAEPRFVVVTAGERSALADAWATDRELKAGDLLRFDIGGIFQGYWSDIGRTAVIGEPSARQAIFYDAVLAGEDAQFALAKPGVLASALFTRAVEVVEDRGGPSPYRRQHCGHGIGLEVYETPIVRPDSDVPIEAGMTFCFETPYYEIGWGGMMVEDTIVVTDDGVRMLTDQVRGLTVVPV